MPATLPHGGLARPLTALRYSLSRKPSPRPTAKWAHGSPAGTGPGADVDGVPREPGGDRAGAGGAVDVGAVGSERSGPAIELEDLLPAVEPGAGAPHRLDDIGEPAIAARQHALDERHAAVVVL